MQCNARLLRCTLAVSTTANTFQFIRQFNLIKEPRALLLVNPQAAEKEEEERGGVPRKTDQMDINPSHRSSLSIEQMWAIAQLNDDVVRWGYSGD